jgi:hypothetical protein
LDFGYKHPDKQVVFLQKWDDFATKIKAIFKSDLKDKNAISLFKKLDEELEKG